MVVGTPYCVEEHLFIFFLCKLFFFDESDVIFRFHNEAAQDIETYNFIEQARGSSGTPRKRENIFFFRCPT